MTWTKNKGLKTNPCRCLLFQEKSPDSSINKLIISYEYNQTRFGEEGTSRRTLSAAIVDIIWTNENTCKLLSGWVSQFSKLKGLSFRVAIIIDLFKQIFWNRAWYFWKRLNFIPKSVREWVWIKLTHTKAIIGYILKTVYYPLAAIGERALWGGVRWVLVMISYTHTISNI